MKKIYTYKYEGTKEEKELDALRHSTYDWSTKDEEFAIIGFNSFLSIDKQIDELNNKINELTNKKKKFNEVKLNEQLFKVWFYFAPDVHCNGGVTSVLTRSQLDRLIKRGNELTDVFFLEIIDLNESLIQGKKIIPDFLPSEIKEQLNNKEYNGWHNRLLSKDD